MTREAPNLPCRITYKSPPLAASRFPPTNKSSGSAM